MISRRRRWAMVLLAALGACSVAQAQNAAVDAAIPVPPPARVPVAARCFGRGDTPVVAEDDADTDDDPEAAAHAAAPLVADAGVVGAGVSDADAATPEPPPPTDCELAEQAAAVTPPMPDPLRGHAFRPDPAHRWADLVVIVSVDGLRPDALSRHRTPMLWQLRREGTWAERAMTIRRAITLPSHSSMLTGTDPTATDRGPGHGVMWNAPRWQRGLVRRPTVFRLMRAAGLFGAMIVAKKKFFHLIEPDGVAEYHRPGSAWDRIAPVAAAVIARAQPGIVFVHFSDPDNEGHSHGWMSRPYMGAVEGVDRGIRVLVDALRARGHLDRVLLIVTADHGGHARTHSGRTDVDRLIPWLAWGGHVRHRVIAASTREVSTLDTAATALWALGFPVDQMSWMSGRPVGEIVQPDAATRVAARRRHRRR